jgi:hypothetical protein
MHTDSGLRLHRAPIPEEEPIPGDEPEPDDDPVPHPDPVIREPQEAPPLQLMRQSVPLLQDLHP